MIIASSNKKNKSKTIIILSIAPFNRANCTNGGNMYKYINYKIFNKMLNCNIFFTIIIHVRGSTFLFATKLIYIFIYPFFQKHILQ